MKLNRYSCSCSWHRIDYKVYVSCPECSSPLRVQSIQDFMSSFNLRSRVPAQQDLFKFDPVSKYFCMRKGA